MMTFLVLQLLLNLQAEPPSVADRWEPLTLTGKALTLEEAFKAVDIPADTGSMGEQVIVREDDGSIRPLIRDDASRAMFQDEQLRGRRVEVQGRTRPGIPYVQVISFRVEEGGKLVGVEYHCDVCAIDVRYPQICPCCQGPMVLRWRADAP